jgi:phosphatidylglycerol:prolipoprotein diacylglycerol transferase
VVPVLFSFRIAGREVSIASYGVLIALGLAAAIALAYRRARAAGMDPGRVLDLAFSMTLGGFGGSRLLYGLVNADEFGRACLDNTNEPRSVAHVVLDCTRILRVWEGGLVFYGGVAAAALVAYRFARAEGWSFAVVGDLFAPPLALGHAFGRLGCFLAGCCFGKASTAGWGVHFPRGSVAFEDLASSSSVVPGSDVTPALHPTQLYESAGDLAIFAALIVLERRLPLRLRGRGGTTMLAYLGLYAGLRFLVELFRGDAARRFLSVWQTPRLAALLHLRAGDPILLSVGEAMSLATLAVVLAVWIRRRSTSPRSAV